MKTLIRSFVALAVVALGGSLALAGQDNPLATPPQGRDYLPSPVVFPNQSIPTRFFHDKHAAQDIDCTQCHDKAPESVSSTDQLIPVGSPGEETCTTCHDFAGGATADPPSACSTCHSNYEPIWKPGRKDDDFHAVQNPPEAMVLPTNNLKMNHKVHLDKGIVCATCHGDVKGVQVATRANALPVMYTCMECHNGQKAPDECRVCHFTEQSGRMITKFDSGTLKPSGHFKNDAHNEGWLQKHAMTAKNDDQYCANCHSPKYCLDCHNGVVKPFTVHPNNWVLTHPLHAKIGDPTCTSCHRSQSFCMDCHKRSGVAPKGEFSAAASAQGWKTSSLGKFHPAGWVGDLKNGSARGENNHAFMAQRNLRSCAACHTEKTCVGCHASGTKSGAGINPHPPSFGASGKCKSLRDTNSRMCATCHMPVPECN